MDPHRVPVPIWPRSRPYGVAAWAADPDRVPEIPGLAGCGPESLGFRPIALTRRPRTVQYRGVCPGVLRRALSWAHLL